MHHNLANLVSPINYTGGYEAVWWGRYEEQFEPRWLKRIKKRMGFLFTDKSNFNRYPSGGCTQVSPLKKSRSNAERETLPMPQKPWIPENEL